MRGRSPPNPGWKFEDYHLPVLLRAFGAARRHLQLQHPTGISWKITRARMLSMGLNGESTNEMMDIQQYTVSSSWPHCRRKTIDDQFQASIGTSSHMNVPTKPPWQKIRKDDACLSSQWNTTPSNDVEKEQRLPMWWCGWIKTGNVEVQGSAHHGQALLFVRKYFV